MNLLPFQEPELIRRVLAGKTVAIVGLSSDPLRASNFVGRYLLHHGYEIIPVNPREKRILGQKSYPSLLIFQYQSQRWMSFETRRPYPESSRTPLPSARAAFGCNMA